MNESIIVLGVFAVIIIILLIKTAVIVPQRSIPGRTKLIG